MLNTIFIPLECFNVACVALFVRLFYVFMLCFCLWCCLWCYVNVFMFMILWDSAIIFTFLPPNSPRFPFHPFPHIYGPAIPLPHQGLFVLLGYFWVWLWGVVSWLSPSQQPRTASNFLADSMPNFPLHAGVCLALSLTRLLCLLSCLLWAAALLCQEDIYGLVVFQHLWLLYSFVPPLLQWFWSLRRRKCGIYTPFKVEPCTVNYSLYLGQLWVSVLIMIYCKQKLLWQGLRKALLCEHNPGQ